MDNLVLILSAAGVPDVAAWSAFVVAIASALAAVLPHPPTGSRWALLRNALDTLALNFGHAANRIAPTTTGSTVPLAALAGLLLLGGCNLAQVATLTPAIGAATSCAMTIAGAVEAHASSGVLDTATIALLEPTCQATLQALANAAAKG